MSTILFDAYWLFSGPPSGRNVLRSLVDAWIEDHPNDDVTLAVPMGQLSLAETDHLKGRVRFIGVKGSPHGLSVMFRLDTRGYDLVFAQNFAPRRRPGTRTAVFVHDVLYLRHPRWFTFAERAYLRLSLWSLARADSILTSSQSEALHVRKAVPKASKKKVAAVGLGLSSAYQRAASRPPEGFDDSSEYFLTVGRLNIRKNVAFCASALLEHDVISPARPLVVVGAADGRPDRFSGLAAAIADGSIVFESKVGDSELKWLYEHALVFVFPSLDEGFGLPILEATDAGARMALSDIPPFRELSRHGPFFDPSNARSVADAVARALLQPPPEASLADDLWRRTVVAARAISLAE